MIRFEDTIHLYSFSACFKTCLFHETVIILVSCISISNVASVSCNDDFVYCILHQMLLLTVARLHLLRQTENAIHFLQTVEDIPVFIFGLNPRNF